VVVASVMKSCFFYQILRAGKTIIVTQPGIDSEILYRNFKGSK